MNKVGIHFGAFSDCLEKQLKEQGLVDKKCERHQQDVDAIVTLCIHGVVTESQAEKIRQKIVNQIAKSVEVIKSE